MEHIDKILMDLEDTHVLSEDGASAELLALLLPHYIIRTWCCVFPLLIWQHVLRLRMAVLTLSQTQSDAVRARSPTAAGNYQDMTVTSSLPRSTISIPP